MKISSLIIILIMMLSVQQSQQSNIRIFMVGDSTMADKSYTPGNPEKGWGQIFPLYLKHGVDVFNHAVNGRSTKNFREEGRWGVVMSELKPGDYVIIQFGHNDQKIDDPNRYASPEDYKQNLIRYVEEASAKGAIPVLATPLSRRSFDEQGNLKDTHLSYTEKVKEVAVLKQVTLLDLNARSRTLIMDWGEEKSKELFMHLTPGQYDRFPEGIVDNTHFSPTGAFRICDLVVEEMKLKLPELAKFFKN
ncbi:rhamnogalacturonan acetylesterase [Belliella pelovolcani]|uniref:Lysophospholipase L1 n=1 Tax=Belliella pelovolcani TaxID=529505 RepID=A0A1N7MUB9_9BACT|nr:rhamnogalacturonan acetylesterase [Belliella pelovolcani]SIS89727.1 Lysophospholipase L1 [Belliella pelovolcani]